ncbi:MAG: hypothetical protein ACLP7Q_26425 [Isosphaeraceae bacterium]
MAGIPDGDVQQEVLRADVGTLVRQITRILDARPDVRKRLLLARRRPWERLLIGVGLLTLTLLGLWIGLFALSWLYVWILTGCSSNSGHSAVERMERAGIEPSVSTTARLHPFAAKALAEHVKFLDASLRQYEKSFRKLAPSEREEFNKKEYAEALAAAESMPVDQDSLRLFDLAISYYATDAWLTWDACVKLGEKFDEDPRLILKGSVEVMQRLGVKPCRDQGIGNFCSLYESYRKDPPRQIEGEGPAPPSLASPGASNRGTLDHQGTIDWLVLEQKFANQKR